MSNGYTGAIDIKVTAGVGGSDLVVINDFNMFDDGNGSAGGASQQAFYRNLVNFTSTNIRGSATGLMVYLGNQSLCGPVATARAHWRS